MIEAGEVPFGVLGTTVGTSVHQRSPNWRGVRWLRQIATGLENRSTREGTQGSNPCLSASFTR